MNKEPSLNPPRSRAWQATYLLAAFAAGLGLMARFWQLSVPAAKVFDEVYFPVDAVALLHGKLLFDVHPPLGKMLIALGAAKFGDTPLGWRIVPALFGVALVALLAYGWRGIKPKESVGSLILIILASLEGMLIVYSRTGLMDGILLFAIMAAYLVSLRVRTVRQALVPGLLVGLATAIKWTGIAVLPAVAYVLWRKGKFPHFLHSLAVVPVAALLFHLGYLQQVWQWIASLNVWLQYLLALGAGAGIGLWQHKRPDPFLAGVALGLCAYFLVMMVAQALGTGRFWLALGQEFSAGSSHPLWQGVLEWHAQAWNYHTHLVATHNWSSSWWTWPFMLRPVSFYYGAVPGAIQGSDTLSVITAMGNPLVWWASTLAVAAATGSLALRAWRRKPVLDHPLLPLLIGYYASLAEWIPVTRLSFIYHYLPSYGFALLVLTYCLAWAWRRAPWKVFGYLCLTVVSGIFFLPLATGMPLSQTWPTAGIGIDQGDHAIFGRTVHLDGWRDSHYWIRTGDYRLSPWAKDALGGWFPSLRASAKLGWP